MDNHEYILSANTFFCMTFQHNKANGIFEGKKTLESLNL